MTEKQINELAGREKVQISDIMSWYRNSTSIQERVDMVLVMKERVKICMQKKIIW